MRKGNQRAVKRRFWDIFSERRMYGSLPTKQPAQERHELLLDDLYSSEVHLRVEDVPRHAAVGQYIASLSCSPIRSQGSNRTSLQRRYQT